MTNVETCFFRMDVAARSKVLPWILVNLNSDKTENQMKFLNRVKDAMTSITYDYAIAKIEPSFDCLGQICYTKGAPVAVGLSNVEWEIAARQFAPVYGSDLATLEELLLFYAYRIAQGYWTLEDVCDTKLFMECKTSAYPQNAFGREIGGFQDGIGNTHKLVKTNIGYATCGPNYLDNQIAIANISETMDLRWDDKCASGVVVLRKI